MEHFSDELVAKLENLPEKEGLHTNQWGRGRVFPYRKSKKWIESKVGKNFDVVFSEFVKLEWIPVAHRNLEGFGFSVELNIIEYIDGIPYCRGWGMLPVNPGRLYVDQQKIIRKMPKTKKANWKSLYQKRIAENFIFLEDYVQIAKSDGIWYMVEVKEKDFSGRTIPPRVPCFHTEDDSNGYYGRWRAVDYHMSIKSKRQLSGKELQKHKLKNDADTMLIIQNGMKKTAYAI